MKKFLIKLLHKIFTKKNIIKLSGSIIFAFFVRYLIVFYNSEITDSWIWIYNCILGFWIIAVNFGKESLITVLDLLEPNNNLYQLINKLLGNKQTLEGGDHKNLFNNNKYLKTGLGGEGSGSGDKNPRSQSSGSRSGTNTTERSETTSSRPRTNDSERRRSLRLRPLQHNIERGESSRSRHVFLPETGESSRPRNLNDLLISNILNQDLDRIENESSTSQSDPKGKGKAKALSIEPIDKDKLTPKSKFPDKKGKGKMISSHDTSNPKTSKRKFGNMIGDLINPDPNRNKTPRIDSPNPDLSGTLSESILNTDNSRFELSRQLVPNFNDVDLAIYEEALMREGYNCYTKLNPCFNYYSPQEGIMNYFNLPELENRVRLISPEDPLFRNVFRTSAGRELIFRNLIQHELQIDGDLRLIDDLTTVIGSLRGSSFWLEHFLFKCPTHIKELLSFCLKRINPELYKSSLNKKEMINALELEISNIRDRISASERNHEISKKHIIYLLAEQDESMDLLIEDYSTLDIDTLDTNSEIMIHALEEYNRLYNETLENSIDFLNPDYNPSDTNWSCNFVRKQR